jgi:hypothetical protein
MRFARRFLDGRVLRSPEGEDGLPAEARGKVAPPDLTLLARNNGGVFPAERISGVIDGRIEIVSHGPRDM